jgi:hypothetical protein
MRPMVCRGTGEPTRGLSTFAEHPRGESGRGTGGGTANGELDGVKQRGKKGGGEGREPKMAKSFSDVHVPALL